MRSVILGLCFLVFTPVLWGADPVKDFTQELSKGQKTVLNEFLATLAESSGGYVLFGDKPMSVDTYDFPSLQLITSPNAKKIALIKGREFWEDLRISNENKAYILSIFETESNCHFVCINRKAFLQTVKENLILFRYVLGPNITPERLLNELVGSGSKFYEVLKNDRVLLEILLGHGKQNAIVQSRLADITDLSTFGQNEEFPLISKKLSRVWAAASKKYIKSPSFGFQSIHDEEFALSRLTVDSGKLKPFQSVQIPHFNCEPDSEETKGLLSTYEQNRAKILKAIGHKNFLEDSLRKFFSTTSQTVEIPAIPKQRELSLPSSKEEIVSKLVEIVHKKTAAEPYAVKKFQAAFLQGVAAREKGKQLPVPFQLKRFNDIHAVLGDLLCCRNLERANAYFERLSTREDLVALVPDEIYYKILKTGKGEIASSKTKRVSFQYSFQILGDPQSKDWGVVKQENLGALIPGMAYSLIGMQQGEERVVYIHPKQAYGEETFYPPNVSIVAQIRLLGFEEGDQPVAIFPPHQIESRDYKDLLAKFEVLRGEEYFDKGVEFWDSIKKSGDFIDFQMFQKIYTSKTEIENSFANKAQEEKFIVDLEYHLLSLQGKN